MFPSCIVGGYGTWFALHLDDRRGIPGIVDDAIVMVGMIGASLIQNNERQKEIITCYSTELENIKNTILNDEKKGLFSIYENAIAEAEKEMDTLLGAIKEN